LRSNQCTRREGADVVMKSARSRRRSAG